MADSYSKWVMTAAFVNNTQAALNSGKKIEWVGLKTSDDAHSIADLSGFNDTTLATAKIKQVASISSVNITGNTVTITGLFNSKGNVSDYYIRTIFLVAKYNDVEFLAGTTVANSSNSAFRIPSESMTEITEFTARPQISVINTSSISTKVDPVASATNERVDSLENDLQNQIKNINIDKQNLWMKLAEYVTKATTETISGVKTFTQTIVGSITGNAGTATKLLNARKIGVNGDVDNASQVFDGTKDILVPLNLNTIIQNDTVSSQSVNYGQTVTIIDGITRDSKGRVNGVNTKTLTLPPIQTTITANAGTATKLLNARSIGGVLFDGTININLPGVNNKGNQDTSGTAANATNATHADRSDRSDSADKLKDGDQTINGSVSVPLDNSMVNVGNDKDIALVKKNGQGGTLVVGNGKIFRLQKSNNVKISPTDTLTDLMIVDENGNIKATSFSGIIQPRNTNLADLNLIIDSGVYKIPNSFKNIPSGMENGAIMEVYTYDGNVTYQILYAQGITIWKRYKFGTTWYFWNKSAADNSVVHNTGTEQVGGDKTFTGNNMHQGNESFTKRVTVEVDANVDSGLYANVAGDNTDGPHKVLWSRPDVGNQSFGQNIGFGAGGNTLVGGGESVPSFLADMAAGNIVPGLLKTGAFSNTSEFGILLADSRFALIAGYQAGSEKAVVWVGDEKGNITTPSGSTLAENSNVVHNSGDESIAGIKKFLSVVQASISGNAGTADKFSKPIKLTFTDGYTGSVSFDGSKDISISITENNTARSDTTSSQSTSNGQVFSVVDKLVTNNVGEVTSINMKTVTLPPAQTTVTGNAGSANQLATARKINGVTFNGTNDIQVDVVVSSITTNVDVFLLSNGTYYYANVNATNSPSGSSNYFVVSVYQTINNGYIQLFDSNNLGWFTVKTGGKWLAWKRIVDTTMKVDSAAKADSASQSDKLSTPRKIGGVWFDGTTDINLPGVNQSGNQNTSGKANTAGTADTAKKLINSVNINGVAFDGSQSVNVNAANDNNLVHRNGDENIGGKKIFTDDIKMQGKFGEVLTTFSFSGANFSSFEGNGQVVRIGNMIVYDFRGISGTLKTGLNSGSYYNVDIKAITGAFPNLGSRWLPIALQTSSGAGVVEGVIMTGTADLSVTTIRIKPSGNMTATNGTYIRFGGATTFL
ncbi:pyocin knob domain-containing protein [Leuconostoc gasicomitatum]|uniref:pyocin knob domain-containing protein n=1 Tax=Leuconostoc gasicomitatum TaxID=115778 RepID=UPI001CC5976A|nr:pyocin knob domain-containing protein [Leuconostoc gasicomitatum]MBZ5968836.1 hypothetical protein [Leuconostoc gasicomitatum]